MKKQLPHEFLEEQRTMCLHNLGCAFGQIVASEIGTQKRKKACNWMAKILVALDEIENLIEEQRGSRYSS